MTYRYLSIAVGLALTVSLTGCLKYEKKANSSTTGTMTMVCDDTFRNIIEQEIDVFEYQYPDAHVLARYATQGEALDSLLSLNTRTVVIARDLTKKERDYLKGKRRNVKSSKIAVDAVALIVNKDNPCSMLTTKEVGDILSGESTHWNDLEPSNLGDIAVVFDDKSSSLVQFMRDSLLHGGDLGPNVYAQGSIPAVVDMVSKNVNAIGVLGVTWITSDMKTAELTSDELAQSVLSDEPIQGATLSQDVKVLKLRRPDEVTAYKPYQQNIFDGTYPLYRPIYMVTTGVSGSLASGFYTFVTGDIGQKIIMKTGIMPARTRIQVVQLGTD
ncbi:MAG: substrate-binding domain-containing protein [Muribaculaceae bacterium]|nr:substrate-binding domain-containing protein [Muribaculaceae bacterium]MDE6702941.1 substrate-binding domain-containing protein [Muribaculaceae bacterium]